MVDADRDLSDVNCDSDEDDDESELLDESDDCDNEALDLFLLWIAVDIAAVIARVSDDPFVLFESVIVSVIISSLKFRLFIDFNVDVSVFVSDNTVPSKWIDELARLLLLLLLPEEMDDVADSSSKIKSIISWILTCICCSFLRSFFKAVKNSRPLMLWIIFIAEDCFF